MTFAIPQKFFCVVVLPGIIVAASLAWFVNQHERHLHFDRQGRLWQIVFDDQIARTTRLQERLFEAARRVTNEDDEVSSGAIAFLHEEATVPWLCVWRTAFDGSNGPQVYSSDVSAPKSLGPPEHWCMQSAVPGWRIDSTRLAGGLVLDVSHNGVGVVVAWKPEPPRWPNVVHGLIGLDHKVGEGGLTLATEHARSVLEQQLRDDPSVQFFPNLGVDRVLVGYAKRLASGHYYVWLVEPQAYAVNWTTFLRGQLGGVLILTTVFVVFTWLLASHFSRRVKRLYSLASNLGRADYGVEPKLVADGDEIAHLETLLRASHRELRLSAEELSHRVSASASVDDDLSQARAIQANLLPRLGAVLGDRTDISLAATNLPARQLGGDFYDVFWLNDDELALVIADVSGKGMPAALMMAVTRTVVRNLLVEGADLSDVLRQTNSILFRDTTSGMYVTVFVAVLSVSSGRLRYANGGHVSALRVDLEGSVTSVGQATGTLVGAFDDELFAQEEIILAKGELLVLSTDGLSEARSPTGHFLDESSIPRLLSAYANAPVHFLLDLLVREVTTFQASDPADDLTVVLVRRQA